MKSFPRIGSALLLGALATALPLSAFAQTTVGANVSVSVTASTTNRIAASQSRANQEIQRRITNLQSLSARIGQMKKVTTSEIANFQAGITSEIATLNTLQAKIDADADLATLKTDVQSITKDYRVYMLVLPQDRIAAAADRVQIIVGLMQSLEPKLQSRISAAQSAGKDMTGANTAYADLQTKVSDANTQATAAVNETASLQPDQGNATVEASNTAAVKDAASKIKAAAADLVAARKDIATILAAVKGTGNLSASSSVSVQ